MQSGLCLSSAPAEAESWIALYGYYYGGHEYRGSQRDYMMNYDPVMKFSLTSQFAVNEWLQAYVTGDNLTNTSGERHITNVDMPRALMMGIRFTY